MGVNTKFVRRLIANGNATIHGTFLRSACTNTKPNVTMMIG